MNSIQFTVLGEPYGKGRPRFNRFTGTAHTPEKTESREALVGYEYRRQCGTFRFPDTAMLDMRILAYYSVPKGDSKATRAAKLEGFIRPTKKPDMDNVVKLVADALNQVAYRDDTQIVDCQCRKFYSEQPRTVIIIKQIGKENKHEPKTHIGHKRSTRWNPVGTTYILHSSGKRLSVAPKGHHASPSCSFTVRGHFRHYRSGKTVWIAEYRKGTGKEQSKTYKIGGDLDE